MKIHKTDNPAYYDVEWEDSDFEAIVTNDHAFALYTRVFQEVERHMENLKYKSDVVYEDRLLASKGDYHLSDDQTDYNRCIFELALAVNDAMLDGEQFITRWANDWLTFAFADDLDALKEAAEDPGQMIEFLVNNRST